mgnify:CR=1 FL=1
MSLQVIERLDRGVDIPVFRLALRVELREKRFRLAVIDATAIILAIVVLGGMGSQIGVVLAAAAIVLLPEALREFSEYRMLVFGLAMVLVMVWRPRGLLAHRRPTLMLNPSRPIAPK